MESNIDSSDVKNKSNVDNLTTLCIDSIVKSDIKLGNKLNEDCLDLIRNKVKKLHKVYLTLEYIPACKYPKRPKNYEWVGEIYSSKALLLKSEQVLDNRVIISAKLDPRFPLDKVYILLNYLSYPVLITNNVKKYIKNKKKFRDFLFTTGHDEFGNEYEIVISDKKIT